MGLPRMEIASRRSIVEEDFISASALKRLVPMLMRRGSRMSQLLFVKEQAVSIENFELAIQVVDKLEELKKRTTKDGRRTSINGREKGRRNGADCAVRHWSMGR